MKALRIRRHLARAPHHSLHVVQAGGLVEQAFVAQPVGRALAAHERVELEQQYFRIQRLAHDLPRAGLERLDPLVTLGHSRAGEDDRRLLLKVRIIAKRVTHVDAAHVGQPHVDHDQIGLCAANEPEKMATRVRSQDGVPVRTEDGLEGTRGPFVLVGEQNEWGTWGEASYRHSLPGAGASALQRPWSRCNASTRSARPMRHAEKLANTVAV